jgi:hypothetical protein
MTANERRQYNARISRFMKICRRTQMKYIIIESKPSVKRPITRIDAYNTHTGLTEVPCTSIMFHQNVILFFIYALFNDSVVNITSNDWMICD